MENQKLYELAVKLAERSGSSIEDCVLMIQKIISVCESVEDAFKQIKDAATRIWSAVKETLEKFEENEAMHGWYIDWDTRKKSQVLNNRPSFAVRKIISVR